MTHLATMASPTLPTHHRALVLETLENGFEVKTVPTPRADPGSAVVRILEAGVISYHREIYNGERHYDFPKPIVGGLSAVGRIVAVGEDAVVLRPGQLVWVDCVVHARDDPDCLFLTAIHDGLTEETKKLSKDVWRDGAFAEYMKAPLENLIRLDEDRLCRELGYSVPELMYMMYLLVPFGGLRDIRVEPGETVVVCPATGGFGGAAVQVAVAMGARVIAMGRNRTELARLKGHIEKTPGAHVETVVMTNDYDRDVAALSTFGPIDAVIDFTPPFACRSTHLKSAIRALRRGGRCSMMGYVEDVMNWNVMALNITLKGKLMYEREDMVLFVKMLERGLFPRGPHLVDPKIYKMDEWKQALDAAAEWTGVGRTVMIEP
jgi:threonine dehydrogenase-like Zn-dependent dehydrogenase